MMRLSTLLHFYGEFHKGQSWAQPFFSPYKNAEFLYENHKFNNLAEKESEKIWEPSCVTEMEWEMGSGL